MKKYILLFAMVLAMGTASADRKYATFVNPSGNGSYDSETATYSWTEGSNNLMTVFTFSNGELANYKALKIVRLGGTYTNQWRANVLYSDNTNQSFIWYNYNDKSIDLSAGKWGETALDSGKTLADIKAIRIGGQNSTGSVILDESCIYLENDNDAVITAAFAKPASSASYSKSTYSATAGSNNLMDVYTKAVDGDFSKYGKLQFEIQSVTGVLRIGFHDGSTFTIIGSNNGYGGGGVKHIDLSSYSTVASGATTIKFGAKDNAGSCTIMPTNMFLVRSEAYDRSFTAGRKSTVWLPFALTAEEVSNLTGKLYELTAATNSTLTFTEVTGATEAYKPYVFIASKACTPFSGFKSKTIVAPKVCSYTVGSATFVGSMKDTNVPVGAYGYNAANGKFSKTTSDAVTIAPFRAYIIVDGAVGAPANLNVVFGEEEATDIENISEHDDANAPIYNVLGQRVDENYKGIIIKNGRKYLVR